MFSCLFFVHICTLSTYMYKKEIEKAIKAILNCIYSRLEWYVCPHDPVGTTWVS